MTSVTVGNLPDETHRAIPENTVHPQNRVKLGSLLADIGSAVGGADLDIERDKTPAEPVNI